MNISNRAFVLLPVMTLVAACIFQTGCSKEDMDKMVSDAKSKASEFKEKSGDALKKATDQAKKATGNIKKTASELSEKASTFKDSASDAVKSATKSASKMVSKAGDALAMNGSAKLTLDTPTEFPACYVRIVSLASGQSVLQMKSYSENGQSDKFPAFFIQGIVPFDGFDGLDGKSVECQFFAQKTPDGELLIVSFQKSQGKMTANFSDAILVNVTNQTPVTGTGSFECVQLD